MQKLFSIFAILAAASVVHANIRFYLWSSQSRSGCVGADASGLKMIKTLKPGDPTGCHTFYAMNGRLVDHPYGPMNFDSVNQYMTAAKGSKTIITTYAELSATEGSIFIRLGLLLNKSPVTGSLSVRASDGRLVISQSSNPVANFFIDRSDAANSHLVIRSPGFDQSKPFIIATNTLCVQRVKPGSLKYELDLKTSGTCARFVVQRSIAFAPPLYFLTADVGVHQETALPGVWESSYTGPTKAAIQRKPGGMCLGWRMILGLRAIPCDSQDAMALTAINI
jgi:hypothetical protein